MEILWWTVRLDEAREVCRRSLEMLGRAETPARIFLMGGMGAIAALANDIDAALSVLDEMQQIPVPPHPALIQSRSRAAGSTAVISRRSETSMTGSTFKFGPPGRRRVIRKANSQASHVLRNFVGLPADHDHG